MGASVDRLPAPAPPRLLAISAGDFEAGRSTSVRRLERWLASLSRAPRVAVLLREKHLSDRDLFAVTVRARALFGGTLLVSGRPDVAASAGADGVHLAASGLPVRAVRARFPDLLVGASTHHLDEVEEVRDGGAHYATFGPVYATPSKRSFGPPQGLVRLAEACRTDIPVLALGGVRADRVPRLLAAGAWGVAGIRCFARRDSASRLIAAMGGLGSADASPTLGARVLR